MSPTAESTAGKTGQQHNSMLLRGKGGHVMTCLQPSKASWLCNSHPGCLTGGILSPTDKPEAREQVSAIVHACPPILRSSCICIIASSLIFSLTQPVPLTQCVTGEGCRRAISGPVHDHGLGRALRPGPGCVSNWQASARLPVSTAGL